MVVAAVMVQLGASAVVVLINAAELINTAVLLQSIV